jgi:4-hydroxybenzoate polyprenyltransferase
MAVVTAQIRVLYGFSRGAQSTLSVAQPLVAVFVVTDHPPVARFLAVAAAALAGFLAVFAANDVLDRQLDGRRFSNERDYDGFDIDSVGARHPMARGELSYVAAVAWVVVLGLVAALVTAWLSPVCLCLFLLAVLLEVAYCRLATVTALKCVLSGIMVAVGACVGAFAMPGPVEWLPLALMCVWMAAWEIGGRNIPNDMVDVAEDVHLGIRTLPVVRGRRPAARYTLLFLLVGGAAAIGLAVARFPSYGVVGVTATVLATGVLLVAPGIGLLRAPCPDAAMRVFNRASFHPVAVLAAFVLALALSR